MTEDEARRWICDRFGAVAADRVSRFAEMVIAENAHQNLVSPASIAVMWTRHLLDSAQLIPFADHGLWLDVGSGGGFPGMVVALLTEQPVVLTEPRRRRADFLAGAVEAFGLATRVQVHGTKVEQVTVPAKTISARAVASVEKLLQATVHCATSETRWILPRGRIDVAQLDLDVQRGRMFHVEHSVTDPASIILIVEQRR